MLIVSLTTTAQRLQLCRIALTSILLQSRLPDQVYLWVSKESYLRDAGISDERLVDKLIKTLPEKHRSLVKVNWVPNTGPYRKLIPMLRKAEDNDLIVTADDDIFYGRDWLVRLLKAYAHADGKVVAARVRIKRMNFLGKKTSYIYWKLAERQEVLSGNFVVTFGGGAILSKSMFQEKDIADDSFLEVAGTADDLWYSKLLMLNKKQVLAVPSILKELNFIQHTDGLTNDNFPLLSSFLKKLRFQTWDRFLGFLGFPVCGNDECYNNINKYFESRK